jgi:hypothetical protein
VRGWGITLVSLACACGTVDQVVGKELGETGDFTSADDGGWDDGDPTASDSGGASGGGEEGGEGGSGGGNDGAGDDDGVPPDVRLVECGNFEIEADAPAPNLMFVLDKSGSMHQNEWLDGNQLETRWETLWDIVDHVTTDFEDRVNFGATLYPKFDAPAMVPEGCEVSATVDVECALYNANAVLMGIPGPQSVVEGATPMADGLTTAISYLDGLDEEAQRVMVLVADGGVSDECGGLNTPGGVESLLEDAYGASDMPTYVVGIDIDAALVSQLNGVAVAGGVPKDDDNEKFYNAQSPEELTTALMNVVTRAIGCTIELDAEPAQPEDVKVETDGMIWPQVEDCEAEAGWQYVNANGPYDEIQLCGDACVAYQELQAAEVTFYCLPQ